MYNLLSLTCAAKYALGDGIIHGTISNLWRDYASEENSLFLTQKPSIAYSSLAMGGGLIRLYPLDAEMDWVYLVQLL